MNHLPGLKSTFVLLVVGAALAGCQSARFQPDPSAEKWEPDIRSFEALNHDSPPPIGGMLLAGGSRFRMWKSAAAGFPEKQVIHRGFGGSQMSDLLHYVDRLVLPCRPAEILV